MLTHSSLAVGGLSLFQIVPIALAGLYGGVLADRFDRRMVQVFGKTICTLCSIALAVGAAGLRAPVGFVYVVASVAVMGWAVEHAARNATIPRLVTPRMLSTAMSLTQVTFQTAMVAGPAVAGVVIAAAGLPLAYAIDAATWPVVVILAAMMSPQPAPAESRASSAWKAPYDAIDFVRSTPILLALFAADLTAMVFGMPTAVFPALALFVFGYGPAVLGLLYAAPAAGALVASLLSGWIAHVTRQGWAVLAAIAVWGAAIAAFGLTGRMLSIGLPLLAVAGGADLVSTVFRTTILQLTIQDSIRGRMSAFHSMVAAIGPRLGDVEAGTVASLVSPTFSVVSGGLACLAGIAVLGLAVPQLRRLRMAGAAA